MRYFIFFSVLPSPSFLSFPFALNPHFVHLILLIVSLQHEMWDLVLHRTGEDKKVPRNTTKDIGFEIGNKKDKYKRGLGPKEISLLLFLGLPKQLHSAAEPLGIDLSQTHARRDFASGVTYKNYEITISSLNSNSIILRPVFRTPSF